jgi:hypothetical protein
LANCTHPYAQVVPDGEDDSDSSDDEYGGIMGMNDDSDESDDEDYLDEMQYDLEPDDSELGDMENEMLGLLKDSG